jgi:PIN domain nuclease of toxin-antitoxin system
LGVSAISPWEIATKVSIGKLRLAVPARDWIMRCTANPGVRLLPLSPEVAWEANNLPPPFHNDPADQIIVATARHHRLSLITANQRIRDYPHVGVFWE